MSANKDFKIIQKLINDNNEDELKEFLIGGANDIYVIDFIEDAVKFALEGDDLALEEHLKDNIPMHVDSDPLNCINDVTAALDRLMIYAAICGRDDIVDVICEADLTPEVSIYQGISDEHIEKAREILDARSELRP